MCSEVLRQQSQVVVFYLYETTVPQPGMDLEYSLTREAVERTLKQNTACRPQQTVLEEEVMGKYHLMDIVRLCDLWVFSSKWINAELIMPFLHPSHYSSPPSVISYQFEWLALLWSRHGWGSSSHATFSQDVTFFLWVGAACSPHLALVRYLI